MNPFTQFVSATVQALSEATAAPLGAYPEPPHRLPATDAPRVLIFSPHPDDEVIVGGLALRLMRQAGWNAINVAVTQGSNRSRQAERWKELTACCAHIGFGLIQTREGGLEGITARKRTEQPQDWNRSVARIADILRDQQPRAILFPHADDWNGTHIGTHHLVVDALKSLGNEFSCYTVETEFWGAMDDPNVMAECSAQDLADLITALTFHVGEVHRNPYHLRLPAWMIDNVRRGGELVGGQGGAPPNFTFATLYRLQQWRGGQFQPVLPRGRFLPAAEDPAALFGQP